MWPLSSTRQLNHTDNLFVLFHSHLLSVYTNLWLLSHCTGQGRQMLYLYVCKNRECYLPIKCLPYHHLSWLIPWWEVRCLLNNAFIGVLRPLCIGKSQMEDYFVPGCKYDFSGNHSFHMRECAQEQMCKWSSGQEVKSFVTQQKVQS